MTAPAAAPTHAPTALTLPADLAAALDADGRVLVRHPRTGAAFRLVREPAAAGGGGSVATEEDWDDSVPPYDDGRTDGEAILAALAAADANPGAGMSVEEARRRMAEKHPEYRAHLDRLAARGERP